MGITGLLPFVEKATQKTNVSQFKGGTVAIDSYCWLHKGVFSCADKLFMGQQTDAYVTYCMRYVHMLLSHNIKPILVFDGRDLPAKEPTEIKRREAREANRRKAIEYMQMGQHAEARNLLRRSLNITHEIALQLIKHCQKMNIDCIVAPYEADAQLAYLNISGIADVVITEDSDLILFGCKKILFKMDVHGNGDLVDQDRLHLVMGTHAEHFEMDKLLHMCILSGCDYLPSLPGIGLNKAKKFVTLNNDCDIYQALTRLGSCLNMKSLVVTKEYRDAFMLALLTFKYQLVFCPLKREQVRLNPPTPDVTEEQLHYAGKETSPDIAFQLALGNYDPFTFKQLHNYDPDMAQSPEAIRNEWGKRQFTQHKSIWLKEYSLDRSQMSPKKTKSWPSTTGRQMKLEITRLKSTIIEKCVQKTDKEVMNQTELLDMYTNNSTTEEHKLNISVDDEPTSPVLTRRNIFAKQQTNTKTSPSLIKVGRGRLRGRNLMRARRTVVDDKIVTESKFFAQSCQKENNVDMNSMIPSTDNTDDILSNIMINNKPKERIEDERLKVENPPIMESYDTSKEIFNDDTNTSTEGNVSICQKSLSTQNVLTSFDSDLGKSVSDSQSCLSEAVSNVSIETNYETAPQSLQELDIDTDLYVEQQDISAIHTNMFKWSNPRQQEQTSRNDSRMSNSSRTSISVSKRRSKVTTVIKKQQNLLSMYGFNKRAN